MGKMEYLKGMPIAVLGGGAAGKTCAADMKLAGCEVRLYDAMPFAASYFFNNFSISFSVLSICASRRTTSPFLLMRKNVGIICTL